MTLQWGSPEAIVPLLSCWTHGTCLGLFSVHHKAFNVSLVWLQPYLQVINLFMWNQCWACVYSEPSWQNLLMTWWSFNVFLLENMMNIRLFWLLKSVKIRLTNRKRSRFLFFNTSTLISRNDDPWEEETLLWIMNCEWSSFRFCTSSCFRFFSEMMMEIWWSDYCNWRGLTYWYLYLVHPFTHNLRAH